MKVDIHYGQIKKIDIIFTSHFQESIHLEKTRFKLNTLTEKANYKTRLSVLQSQQRANDINDN